MRSFSRAIDRFCFKHPKFGVTNLMLYIVIGNAIVYLISMMDRTGQFMSYLYFNAELILRGQVWRLVTFLFIPVNDGILWEAISLYFYYFIGNSLEQYWGSGKFTVYYFFGVIFNIIYGVIVSVIFWGTYIPITAAYINLSMFFAFAMLFPDVPVMVFFILPVKIKWLAWIDAAFFAWAVITTPLPLNLMPVVAILNFLLFFAGDFYDMFRSGKAANSKQAINFRKAARQAKKNMDSAPYRHKCAVCGRTDVSNPELEFRYCSRCQGYHCFCQDHINNHVHFTE